MKIVTKILIQLTLVNASSWALMEIWSNYYANTNIKTGIIIIIIAHALTYYSILLKAKGRDEIEYDRVNTLTCNHEMIDLPLDRGSSIHYMTQECLLCGARHTREKGKEEIRH